MSKVKFVRECGVWYAEENEIEIEDGMTDRALARVIGDHVGKQEFQCEVCDHFVQDEDKTCWYCGEDVSEDDSGGWDKVKPAEKEPAKKEKKKVDVRKTKKEKKAKEAEEVEETAVEKREDDGVSLRDRIEKIRAMDANTGMNAWKIGRELFVINKTKKFEEEYKNFDDFCEKALGYKRTTAYAFLRIAQRIEEEDAGKVGFVKLMMIASAPEAARSKLLKAASFESGGKSLTREELREKINEFREKEKEKRGNDGGKRRGRPPGSAKSKFMPFVGQRFNGKNGDDESVFVFALDEQVGIEFKQMKRGAKITFVQLQ